MDMLNSCDSHESVENMVTEFTNVMLEVADPLFAKNKCTSQCKHDFSSNRLPLWMCDECNVVRNSFYQHLHLHRTNSNEESRLAMVAARNSYVKHTRKCRLQYDKVQTDKLLKAGANNAR